jgi:hypothetical protein
VGGSSCAPVPVRPSAPTCGRERTKAAFAAASTTSPR